MQNKVVPIIVAVLVVAVLGVGGYVLTHRPSSTDSASKSTTTSSASTDTTTSGDIVQTKTDATVGSYLADASGNTLYTYGSDTPGVSNCSGSCLYSWPIYDASNAPASLPTNVTVITRSDGSKQYAYKGMPLYTFTADSAGQVTGDNVSNFHVAKP